MAKETKEKENKKQEKTENNNSSNVFLELFQFMGSGIKLVFGTIFKPFMSVFGHASSKVDKVYQGAKQVKKEAESEEEPKTFWAKVWKVLNSDVSKEGRKMSKRQQQKLEAKKQELLKELNSNDTKRLENGVVFVYKAKTKSGKLVTGRLFGFSKMDINAFLLNEGYEPYTIENNKWIDFMYGDSKFGSRRMSNKDLIFWLTQLSTYVKAGITLSDAMKILMNQSSKDKTKLGIYQSIVYELTMGSSFSEAIAKQGTVFPPLLINMLKQ